MKRTFILIMMLMLSIASIDAQKTYALIAGVSNYGVDSINLYNTTKDVSALNTVFKKHKFTSVRITSKYANHDNIVKKLKGIISIAKPNDRIIFYFSGHGTPGGFVPSDRSLFNYQELVNILSKAKARNIFCIIDACMSGSVKSISRNNFGIGDSTPHICFITASDATEVSKESSVVGHGYFTKALLKAWRGMANKNKDNVLTLTELFNYVYNDVVYRTRNHDIVQHPQLLCDPSMKSEIMASW